LISEIQDRIGAGKDLFKDRSEMGLSSNQDKEGDEWKAAFRSKELYEPLVMHFGAYKRTSNVQKRINSVLGEHLDEFVMAYLDELSSTPTVKRSILSTSNGYYRGLTDEKIADSIEKCEFHTKKRSFVDSSLSQDNLH